MLFSIVFWQIASAQKGVQISGIVTDINNQPLMGASIFEKDTNNGTVANIDGKFTLNLTSDNAKLVISYISYITKEIEVGNKTNFNIVLEEDNRMLEQAVVLGYVTRKKGELTGSVVSLDNKELEKTSTMNLTKSLQGKVPGMIIADRGGYPGDESLTMLIRGKSTLGNNSPLVVVDGIPSSNLSSLAPQDIESLTVLKDGAAAIYGARAANGVIVVTTKRGTQGHAKVSFSSMYKASSFTTIPDVMDSWQYATWQNEIAAFNGTALPYTDEDIAQYKSGNDPINYPNTDWYDLTMREYAPETRNSVSISGGTENVQYFVSGDAVSQSGMFASDILKHHDYQIRSNIDVKLNDYVKVGVNLSARKFDRTEPGVTTGNIYKSIWVNSPTSVGQYPNGLYGWGAENGTNPRVMSSEDSGFDKVTSDEIRANFTYDIDLKFITKGLTLKGLSSIYIHNGQEKLFHSTWDVYTYDKSMDEYNKVSGYNFNSGNFLSVEDSHNRTKEQMHSFQIHYSRSFGEHNLQAFVGTEMTKGSSNNFSAYKKDLVSADHTDLFAGGEEGQTSTGYSAEWGRLNYFGDISYNYKRRYLLDFTLRYDGSNNFADGHRFGTFPGISAGWVISDEKFMDFTNSWLDNLKIRASWAIMGNDRVPAYQYMTKYNYGGTSTSATPNYYIFGENGTKYNAFHNSNVPNPDITWEKADMKNIGVSFSVLGSRLSGDVNYYYQKRRDILVTRAASVPDYSALQLPQENIGKVDNYGVEIQMNWADKIGDFSYNVGFNFTQAKNEVKYLDEAANVPEWQKQEGHPMDSYLVYPTDGLLQADDFNEDGTCKVPCMPNAAVGTPKYLDTNDNDQIDQLDCIRKYTSAIPEIQYSFNAGGSWRNFDFNILFQGQTNSEIELCIDTQGALPTFYFDERWTPTNTSAKYPRALTKGSPLKGTYLQKSSEGFADFWLQDASFLRLKDITIGYTIPKKLLGKISARIFVEGTNLLTFKCKGMEDFDPEMSGYHSFNSGLYAPLKSYTAGINIKF